MTEIQTLVGSLSNDLFRVASLTQRGSKKASERFSRESKRWAKPLLEKDIPVYLKKIVTDVTEFDDPINLERAEKLLMYAILLQNYSVSLIKDPSKAY